MKNEAAEENLYQDFERGICPLLKGLKVDDAKFSSHPNFLTTHLPFLFLEKELSIAEQFILT